ncbi:uncharacterized protein LOC113297333 isoform X1 [Papaver somniferum]|uniref:uncharacterized protein LOC113297333 isoform X1 n=1 Tax=Papaver somniferum TaxID=3469 RepID=UPI000E6F5148|nr:uncharacterized protein LOC113297333 isoform X1 [Papaver somniferum]
MKHNLESDLHYLSKPGTCLFSSTSSFGASILLKNALYTSHPQAIQFDWLSAGHAKILENVIGAYSQTSIGIRFEKGSQTGFFYAALRTINSINHSTNSFNRP